MPNPTSMFLDHPGVAGPIGALMDEYARAAEDFCRAVEAVPAPRFEELRDSPDPDCISVRRICAHVVAAAFGYSNLARRARRLPESARHDAASYEFSGPRDVRPALARAMRYTEDALEGFYDVSEPEHDALTFKTRWAPGLITVEVLLEHAIVHLLRHRRQIERW